MKKYTLFFVVAALFIAFSVKASTLEERVNGRILLQVQRHGEAWYVSPTDSRRTYLKDGDAAYSLMRNAGLGITDVDLAQISQVDDAAAMNSATSVCSSDSLVNRVSGRILLQVQQHGEAWYVDPIKCRAIYMKDGLVAYQIMRYLGLGITDSDLEKIPVSGDTSSSSTLSGGAIAAPSPVSDPVSPYPSPNNSTDPVPPTVPAPYVPPAAPDQPTDPTVPDPTARGVADCTNKKDFTMALIFVAKNGTSAADLDRYKDELDYARNRFPAAFNYATGGLATMSIPDSAAILYSPTLQANTELYTPDILKEFYKSAPDNYDFVTIYTNAQDVSVNASHGIVKNSIKGIGLTSTFDNTALFGSGGRLMGINSLGNRLDGAAMASCYNDQKNNLSSFTFSNDCGVGVFLHETAHQWAAYGPEAVPAYDPSVVSLPLRDSYSHYYYGIDAPAGTYDPLGLVDWQKSPDNSVWINMLHFGSSTMKFHPFTLYFMGLLPLGEYGTEFNVLQNHGGYDDGTVSSESMQTVYSQISVNDIISHYGPRSCGAYEHVVSAN